MAPRVIRKIRIEGNIAFVPLTKGYEAIVDVDDVPLVAAHNWRAAIAYRRSDGEIRTVYAVTRAPAKDGTLKTISLQRMLMGTPIGMETDHCDGNGLDNRRANLRVATRSENQRNGRARVNNTSGFKGVSWCHVRRRWRVRIMVNRKCCILGRYIRLEDAAAAYARASKELHGEFGRTG